MKARILSLIGALALCSVAMMEVGKAEAACSLNCAKLEQQCLAGCPCGELICDPANCWSQCVCPIFCPSNS